MLCPLPGWIINYAAIRYMGPRQVGDDDPTVAVLGRYALHFHHAMDGSRGSVVRGTVVRDAGSHAYAAHMSNGVTALHIKGVGTGVDEFCSSGPMSISRFPRCRLPLQLAARP